MQQINKHLLIIVRLVFGIFFLLLLLSLIYEIFRSQQNPNIYPIDNDERGWAYSNPKFYLIYLLIWVLGILLILLDIFRQKWKLVIIGFAIILINGFIE